MRPSTSTSNHRPVQRGRDQWNSKLKLFSANGSLSASVLCLKLPQTMTSNNHREAGPARVKRIENVTNGWTFQHDFSRWLAEIEDTPGVSASRGQQSRTFVGSWATIRKPGSERIVEFYSKQEKMTERMKLSAGQWNYNYCKTSLVCKINYLTHDFYQKNIQWDYF